jgi:hypothetical protein
MPPTPTFSISENSGNSAQSWRFGVTGCVNAYRRPAHPGKISFDPNGNLWMIDLTLGTALEFTATQLAQGG